MSDQLGDFRKLVEAGMRDIGQMVSMLEGSTKRYENIDLSNCDLSSSTFNGVDFAGADFSNSDLTNANFVACDLSRSKFLDVDFSTVSFINCKMDGMSIHNIDDKLDHKTTTTDPEARRNESLLSRGEQKFIAALLENIPRTVTPLHLTLFGIAGAVLTFVGFVGCNWSAAFLPLVPVGLFMNWFGDSLDGALARYRRIQRPRFGFLIDHTIDLVTQTMMLAGLGLSPYFTMTSALLILSMYLLFSAFTYIRVVIDHVHQRSYGGLGGTEFRIMMAAWALGAHILGPFQLPKIGSYSILDVVVGVFVAGACAVFIWNLRQQLDRLAGEESAEVVVLFNKDESVRFSLTRTSSLSADGVSGQGRGDRKVRAGA